MINYLQFLSSKGFGFLVFRTSLESETCLNVGDSSTVLLKLVIFFVSLIAGSLCPAGLKRGSFCISTYFVL